MKLNGVVINGLKIVNESNNSEVIAEIKDGHIETTNGYRVEVVPYNIECCD